MHWIVPLIWLLTSYSPSPPRIYAESPLPPATIHRWLGIPLYRKCKLDEAETDTHCTIVTHSGTDYRTHYMLKGWLFEMSAVRSDVKVSSRTFMDAVNREYPGYAVQLD